MISKCIAFLVAALVLANCCASGIGCGAPTGGPVAWDGLGPTPTEDAQPIEPPRPNKRSKKEVAADTLGAADVQQNSKLRRGDSWEQQQAADQDDEMRLKRKLMICRNCGTESSRDDAAASAPR